MPRRTDFPYTTTRKNPDPLAYAKWREGVNGLDARAKGLGYHRVDGPADWEALQ